MPVILPDDLPVRASLLDEDADLLADRQPRAAKPLRVALLNLMPDKPATETQFARLIGASPQEVELVLLRPASHDPGHTDKAHLRRFYRLAPEVFHETFEGLIVTGAPVEHLPFEEVDYWRELTAVFDWATTHVGSALYVCWAGQAALYHRHGVPKRALQSKLSGVYPQSVTAASSGLMAGLWPRFPTPVSRHTEVRISDLPPDRGLRVLAASAQSGLCLVEDRAARSLSMFNHLEYDGDTLRREYERDIAAGKAVPAPVGMIRERNASMAPPFWRPYARRFFENWIASLPRAERSSFERAA